MFEKESASIEDFMYGATVAQSHVSIRLGFLRKVYGILSVQLGLTTLIGGIMMFFQESVRTFLKANVWVLFACLILNIVVLIVMYVQRKTTPHNFVCLFLFTLIESITVGFVIIQYEVATVLISLFLTLLVSISLTIYTFQTKRDFSTWGAGLFAGLLILCFGGIIQCRNILNMNSNPTNETPITNELRSNVIKKFRSLHAELKTHVTPEMLEKNCFDKSNNNQEYYLKLCNNLVTHRTVQLQNKQNSGSRVNIPGNQVRVGLNPALRPNLINQNNGVPSDPINALQTLAVTAGQPNQMNIQQNNYRMGQSHIIQMVPNGQNFRIVGSIRPIDGYTMQQQQQPPQHLAQSPNSQLVPSQIQQMPQLNNIRVVKKPDLNISQSPGYMESNGSLTNQMMTNTNVVRPPVTRLVTSSSMSVSIPQQPSPQDHFPRTSQVSLINTSVSNGCQLDVSAQSNLSSNITPIGQSVAQIVNEKPPISEEEAMQVKEELTKLKEKYFNYIKLAIENPLDVSSETQKIWLVLKNVLDNPSPTDKRITLKHVAKIQLFSEKAEKHVLQHNLISPKQAAIQSSEELFGKRIIPDRNKMAFNAEPIMDSIGISTNNNSLDLAFDDIIHKISKQNPEHKRKVIKGIIKYIMEEKKLFVHFIPKHLQPHNEQNDVDDKESKFDEHEFDFIENLKVEGENNTPFKIANGSFDENGFLRTDRKWSHYMPDSVDVQRDIKLISKEFEVILIEPQIKSDEWVSVDSEWENSLFYSIKFMKKNLPYEVPSIYIRIPEDYEQSSAVDWNLNLHQYQGHSTDVTVFLSDIGKALQDEFSNLNSRFWNGVPFLDIVSIYKRGIETGFSNYECRNN